MHQLGVRRKKRASDIDISISCCLVRDKRCQTASELSCLATVKMGKDNIYTPCHLVLLHSFSYKPLVLSVGKSMQQLLPLNSSSSSRERRRELSPYKGTLHEQQFQEHTCHQIILLAILEKLCISENWNRRASETKLWKGRGSGALYAFQMKVAAHNSKWIFLSVAHCFFYKGSLGFQGNLLQKEILLTICNADRIRFSFPSHLWEEIKEIWTLRLSMPRLENIFLR